MDILIITAVLRALCGVAFYCMLDVIKETGEMTYPQFFFIGFLLGPIVFIGTVGVFIYNMLGKINWK